MTDKAVILTTTASEAEASKIASVLVEQRLAACVNIVPRVHSIYYWQGKAERGEEYLLLIKSSLGSEDEPTSQCTISVVRRSMSPSLSTSPHMVAPLLPPSR